ncbi:MAG: hypothetical protein H0W06_05325 [Chloroflexia bacterium]|nr:hypothetical protein [Chloroflexia bacterium]
MDSGSDQEGIGDQTGSGGQRTEILGQVKNPLIFFSLCVLLVEGILSAFVLLSKFSAGQQLVAFLVMVGVFLVVIGVVSYITIFIPANLYEQVKDVRKQTEEVTSFINTPAFSDAVAAVVDERVKEESLVAKRPSEGA